MTSMQTHPTTSRLRFELPPELVASAPPEARGLARHDVRLLVATPHRLEHTSFSRLAAHLEPGDLVVVNTSATLPAAVDGWRSTPADGARSRTRRRAGSEVVVHVAGPDRDGPGWVVELRRPDGSGPVLDASPGERIDLAEGVSLHLLAPHPATGPAPSRTRPSPDTQRSGPSLAGVRLWIAEVDGPRSLSDHLDEHGRAIAYGYVPERWPLGAYQTVFAQVPGSAEMVSAARPFSERVVTELVARGITMAPIVLHTGVSSLEAGEAPQPERFQVPAATAALVEHTRRSGGRVVAVGTTVTRALESVADTDGTVHGGEGWTDLVLGPDRPARVVDGLVTGWHESDASHLDLLEAVAGSALVERAYGAALTHGYLWHEFGDSCLLLP